jgi:hypothetical protein
MPLFAIHRTLDPKMTDDERELMVVRSIGFAESPLRPTWRRTFAIQTDNQFETWCMYEGRNAEEIAWWNDECSVPFSEVRPVTQWRREEGLILADGEGIHWLRGRLNPSREPEQLLDDLRLHSEAGDAKWLRLFWDASRRQAYAAVAAPDAESARRFADAVGLPHEQHDVVDQILPTDFAPLYETLGFTPYSGDD